MPSRTPSGQSPLPVGLPKNRKLSAITEHLHGLDKQQLDALRRGRNTVRRCRWPTLAPSHWKAFASLVLEGAYEATLWTAVQNAQRGASNVVLLALPRGLEPLFSP